MTRMGSWRVGAIALAMGGLVACGGGGGGGSDAPGATSTRTATPTVTPGPVQIVVNSTTAQENQSVNLGVVMRSNGLVTFRIENVLLFDTAVPIAQNAVGEPDCSVNPVIEKDSSSFEFLPRGCIPERTCMQVSAEIRAANNRTIPIPNGAVVYTCRIVLPARVALPQYEIGCSNPRAFDDRNRGQSVVCEPGILTVLREATATRTVDPNAPTRTPTGTATLTPTRPTQTPSATRTQGTANLTLSKKAAPPGSEISLEAFFQAQGFNVRAMEFDVAYDAAAPPLENVLTGEPDCAINETLVGVLGAFSYVPTGCIPGDSCEAMHILVDATGADDPLPATTRLLSCRVVIDSRAPIDQTFPFDCLEPAANNEAGGSVPLRCESGSVRTIR